MNGISSGVENPVIIFVSQYDSSKDGDLRGNISDLKRKSIDITPVDSFYLNLYLFDGCAVRVDKLGRNLEIIANSNSRLMTATSSLALPFDTKKEKQRWRKGGDNQWIIDEYRENIYL